MDHETVDPAALNARIVVVDDDPAILDLVSFLLTRRGYRVSAACDAGTALNLVAEQQPELVLMDYILPGQDGLSVLRSIREQFPATYVIMFSGQGSEEIVVELMKAGAAEYLLKPFNNRTLLDRVEGVLRLREIEQANRALQTERERLLLEIEIWNRELQQRVREKSEALQRAQTEITQTEKLAALGYLSAGMAHEIRNPLNSIALFTQLLKQGIEDEEQREYLDKTLKEVERIDGIIRRLVDAAGRSRSIQPAVQVDRVIAAALEVFAPQIEARRITVNLQCLTPPPPMKADPAELEQIFTNLFLNALEEMPPGGRLSIAVTSDDGRIVVRVSDTGGGIGSDLLETVFEPFFTTKNRGTGIGLPVVRRIARLYHGDVTIEQTSAQGTTFRVAFSTHLT